MTQELETPNPAKREGDSHGLVQRLRREFDANRTRDLAWRKDQLARIDSQLREDGESLVKALAADLGRPEFESWGADLGAVLGELATARKGLARWARPEKVRTPLNLRPGRSWIVREPLGVVLVIAPWNYPVQLSLLPLIGAIAAGNCAVLKPSEVAPRTSAALSTLLSRALEPACFQVVEGGAEVTQSLLDERFDHVFYTGNATVGRIVMEAAARQLTPVTLELGGKSPCLVDEDVDLRVAARRIAWGKWINAGQTCIAPDYVLVHENREAELIAELREVLREFYGEDPRESADFGRIVNKQHVRRLEALMQGADVVHGGEVKHEDCYIEPTIIRDLAPDSPAMREEIFGPILPVIAVADMDSAVQIVNRGDKPLALYLFTRNRSVEERVISSTSSGGVCINATLWHAINPHLPFGGVGSSGMGSYHGKQGFETFSHHKSVLRKPSWPDPPLMYPPYRDWKMRMARRLL